MIGGRRATPPPPIWYGPISLGGEGVQFRLFFNTFWARGSTFVCFSILFRPGAQNCFVFQYFLSLVAPGRAPGALGRSWVPRGSLSYAHFGFPFIFIVFA